MDKQLKTRIRRSFSLASPLLSLGLLVLFFQACSGCNGNVGFTTSQTTSDSSSVASTVESGGDGRPIEGKLQTGTFYHFVPGLKCNAQMSFAGTVTVTPTAISQSDVNQDDCSVKPTVSVSLSDIDWSALNPSFLGYGQGIYQYLASPPSTDPQRTSNAVPVAEAWCRLHAQNESLDVLVMQTPATRELSAKITRLKLFNSGWRSATQTLASVSRSSSGSILNYSATGLVLTLDRQNVSASGTVSGHVGVQLGGDVLDENVECRVGSDFDSMALLNPGLSFNLTDGQLPASLSFARQGAASYFDPTGNVMTVSDNQPRFDFDPTTGRARGLLLEETRTNLLTQSMNLAGSAWIYNGLLVTLEGQLAGLDRFRVAANDPTATNIWGRTAQQVSIVSGQTYTLSFFAGPANQNSARVFIWYGPGSEGDVDFDLSAGQSSIVLQNVISIASVAMDPVNGGYRVSIVFTSSVSGQINVGIGPRSVVVGDAIYATGAQLEVGASPSSYIPTSDSTVTRGADQLSFSDLSWFNGEQGTVRVALEQLPSSSASQEIFAVAGNGTDRLSLVLNATYSGVMDVAGSLLTWSASSTPRVGSSSTQQVALAYESQDASFALNGTVQPASGPVAVGIAAQSIGFSGTEPGSKWNGHLRDFIFWGGRLPDAALMEETR